MFTVKWWLVCVVGAFVMAWVDERLEIKLPWWRQIIQGVCYMVLGGLLASI